MKTFLIIPYSNKKNRSDGVKYIEALKVENGIGYFPEDEINNPYEFHCKSVDVNKFFYIGDIRVEKCFYDITGNQINHSWKK